MLCKWCGKRFADIADWPDYDRAEYRPDCCHQCYVENPARVLEPGHTKSDEVLEEAAEEDEENELLDRNELIDIEDMGEADGEEDQDESEP